MRNELEDVFPKPETFQTRNTERGTLNVERGTISQDTAGTLKLHFYPHVYY